MKYVNVMFGNDTSDVDIILVPDDIADNIDELGQQFNYWLSREKPPEYFRIAEDGTEYTICETDGFVDYLNRFHCKDKDERATIVIAHTDLNPGLLVVEF